VEYGRSWADLELGRRDAHSLANPICDGFLSDLSGSLDNLNSDDSRYTFLARAVETVDRAARDELSQMRAPLLVIEDEIVDLQLEVERLEAAHHVASDAATWIESLEALLAGLAENPPEISGRLAGRAGASKSEFTSGHAARRFLENLAERFDDACTKAWAEWVESSDMKRVRRQVKSPRPTMRNRGGMILRAKTNCCGDCSSNGWKFWTDDPDECWRRQYNGSIKASEKINRELDKSAQSALEGIRSLPAYIDKRKTAKRARRLEEHLNRSQEALEAAQTRRRDLQTKLDARQASFDADRAQAANLRSHLRDELLHDLDEVALKVGDSDRDDRVGWTLLGLVTLKSWYQLNEGGA
jgi:hypothetical protein